MQKPNNYDATPSGEYIPVELGGHTAIVKRVEETTSKNGKPMIKVAIDFDSNDLQPNFFMDSFKNDTREDKKWPFQATQYILAEDQDGKCSTNLKRFITSVERSNNAECQWGDTFEKWFVNKKVGVVFGEVEEEYQGEIKTRRRIRYFCDYEKAKGTAAPEKKTLNTSSTPTTNNNDFMKVPDGLADEIPF